MYQKQHTGNVSKTTYLPIRRQLAKCHIGFSTHRENSSPLGRLHFALKQECILVQKNETTLNSETIKGRL